MTKFLTALQSPWYSVTTAAILAYLAPMYEIFAVMFGFVIADLITGIMASRKRRVACSSRRLRISIEKVFGYVGVLLLIYAAQRAFGAEWLCGEKVIGGFICLVELLSILENLATITERPIYLKLIKLIRGRAAQTHGSIVNDILDEKNEKHNQK